MDPVHERSIENLYMIIAEGLALSISDFIKFCKRVRIYPDLLNSLELRKILLLVTGRNNRKPTLTQEQFKQLISTIADFCFASYNEPESRTKLLIDHISNPCILHYSIDPSSSELKKLVKKESLPLDIEMISLTPLTSRTNTDKKRTPSTRKKPKESLSSIRSPRLQPTPKSRTKRTSTVVSPGVVTSRLGKSTENGRTLHSTADTFREGSHLVETSKLIKKNSSKLALKLGGLVSPRIEISTTRVSKSKSLVQSSRIMQISEALDRFKKAMRTQASVPILGALAEKALINLSSRRVSNRHALKSAFTIWSLIARMSKLCK